MAYRSPSAPVGRRRLGVTGFVLAASLALVSERLPAAPIETGFVRKTFHDQDGAHGYVVYLPQDYAADRAWPVMLFLHGAGERGSDGFRQAEVGLGSMIRRWGSFPWIVVFPQAEDTRGPIKTVWSPDAPDGKRALAILDEVERTYRVDPARRVLTGWSMGGRGTYMLAAAFPQMWSAALPIAGWADLDLAGGLAQVPLWAFHGTADTLVSFDEDRELIETTRRAGGRPWFTVLPDEGHYIWRTVYASPVVFEWLSDPGKFAERDVPPELDPNRAIELPLSETHGPFIPAIELDNAVAIRIGPDLFQDLSQVAEDEIRKRPFGGTMPGTSTESTESCITFDVRTSAIRYRVPVAEVDVTPMDSGRLRLRLSVTNAQLRVGRTDVRGGLFCAATAGPMCVVLAHRKPIPVEVEAEPYVTENEFRLKTRSVRFAIPQGNWYVTKPAVDSHSLFLPSRRVADSLVEGVYSSKAQIERDFRKSVADAVDELKLELPPVTDDQLLTALWPVPAYRPRIKPRLQQVGVSDQGLAVVFGLTVAAVDPFDPPASVRTIDLGLSPGDVGQGDIAVTAAENLVSPLTTQLIEAGLAHVNVVDIPGGDYAHLADRETLAEAIPALSMLPPTAQVRTELYLRKPLDLGETEEIEQVCSPDGCYSQFDLRLPDITVLVSVRQSADAEWRNYAEFSYDVTQPVRISIGAEAERGREVGSGCTNAAAIRTTARWLTQPPADDRLDTVAAAELFERGWSKSAQVCGPVTFVIPDIDLRGYVRRLERLEASPRGMSAVFEEPETVLSNESDLPLVYRTRTGDSSWSPMETLLPGERRAYRVSRSLQYEGGAGDRQERYDIPPGRDATFRSGKGEGSGLLLDPLPVPPAPRENLPGTGG